MSPRSSAILKYLVGPLFAAVASIAVARIQQGPQNARGAVGYATLADRVNTLEAVVERDRQDIRMLLGIAAQSKSQGRSPTYIPVQPGDLHLVPLRRVPSRFEHLAAP